MCSGESGKDLIRQIKKNNRDGIATTVHLLGETVRNDSAADLFPRATAETIIRRGFTALEET